VYFDLRRGISLIVVLGPTERRISMFRIETYYLRIIPHYFWWKRKGKITRLLSFRHLFNLTSLLQLHSIYTCSFEIFCFLRLFHSMFRPVHGVKQTCGKSQDNESENESGRQVRKESRICFSFKERKSKLCREEKTR
jgi:hypothetical protein